MGIQCDECEQWFHVRPDCCDLSHEMYEMLANSSCSWICPLRGLPDFSEPFFDNLLHSLCTSNSLDPLNGCDAEVSPPEANCKQTSTKASHHSKPNRKPRRLTCLVINCRSLKNKIADIAAVIDEHKADVILGNESWLTQKLQPRRSFRKVILYLERTESKVKSVVVFSKQ